MLEHGGLLTMAASAPLTRFTRSREPVAFVLDEDPDLLEAVPPSERERARDLLRAQVVTIDRGAWEPPDMGDDSYGMFVLDGLVIRSFCLGRARSAEILGPGDLLRPWDRPLLLTSVATTDEWRVVHRARVAVLDARASAVIAHWPALAVAVGSRLLRRARCLSYMMAAGHFVLVEDRLLATLWHVASMWGRVTPQGVVVPWKLTHDTLADVVGARRPSVTTSLGQLQRRGLVTRRGDGLYVLHGEPPEFTPADLAGRAG